MDIIIIVNVLLFIVAFELMRRLLVYLFSQIPALIFGRVLWVQMLWLGQEPVGINKFADKLDRYFWKVCRANKLRLSDEARLAILLPIIERYRICSKQGPLPAPMWKIAIDSLMQRILTSFPVRGSDRYTKLGSREIVMILANEPGLIASIFDDVAAQTAAVPA